MQLNKETETAKWLKENMPFLLEDSVHSTNKTDYVVFIPIENEKNTIFKDSLKGVKHLELIKLVKENWVDAGKNENLCIIPDTSHNVSNTVIIDNYEEIVDYIYNNQHIFAAVSFISEFGDKEYNQSPNTSVLSSEELLAKYGTGSILASGLIVDGLHYFNDDLWRACECALDKKKKLIGTREQLILQKYWLDRAKNFAKNYFNDDFELMINCLKDVHLFHKWHTIKRQFKKVNFNKILTKPTYKDVDELGAMACSGNQCELVRV